MAKKKSTTSGAGANKSAKKKPSTAKKKSAGKPSTADIREAAAAITAAAEKMDSAAERMMIAIERLGAVSPRMAAAEAATRAPGKCLSLSTSDQIVDDAVRNAAPGIDEVDFEKTLEDHSIFTEGQRNRFRDDVFDQVLQRNCQIEKGKIPNDADSVLRDISEAVQKHAR